MAGSIQKRGDNKYLLTISDGFDLNGKRRRFTRTVAAKSNAEANRLLSIFYAEVAQGDIRDDKGATLESYTEYWLKKRSTNRGSKRSIKTVSEYRKLTKRVYVALGHIRLSKLTPRHLSDFYDMLREDGIREDGRPGGLSENTISHYHRFLRAVLETAFRMDRLIPENPADDVIDPPTPGRSKAKVYDDEQTIKLLATLTQAPIKYQAFIWITLFMGNRRGETLGLEWADIDFSKNKIYINRSSQYVAGEGIYDSDAKNDTSLRNVNIPPEVTKLLREYKIWQNKKRLRLGEKWIDTDRLFTQRDGSPMHPDTPSKWFNKFLKANNLSHITLHQLRHTNASLLIAEGVDLVTIGERLGHADKATTPRIYGHMLQKSNEKAAKSLADVLLRNNKADQNKAE